MNRPAVVAALVLALSMAAPARAFDVNSYRAAHGMNRLVRSAKLNALAAGHARDMARRNSMDHDGYMTRLPKAGDVAGENVAWGCSSADCAYRLWAESPGHAANMLMRGVTRYGLASAAGHGRRFWCLIVGTK